MSNGESGERGTKRRWATVAALAIAFLAVRSFVLPSNAPAWLRGTSPFNWIETRAERNRCLAFGSMMGPNGRTYANYGDDRKSGLTVEIDRGLRAGDSLVFEGHASRGRTTQILFHCATANVRGHPGEHRTELAQPWGGVPEEWSAVRDLEARIERACADSAAARFPTARISPRMLVLRQIFTTGEVHGMAVDTVYDVPRTEFVCDASAADPAHPMVTLRDR
ncbi:MAG TPA: hypothetical protein VHM30_09170 [Gemmatimonadaceae bacterium]|nr:hypothetical protein [Gemmatimonadaceae bacterium]